MKRLNRQKGISQILILVIMGVLAVALPVTTKLVQQNQENRSSAVSLGAACSDHNKLACSNDKKEVLKCAYTTAGNYWKYQSINRVCDNSKYCSNGVCITKPIKCGTATSGSYSSAPSSNLCGEWTVLSGSVYSTGDTWYWYCRLSGGVSVSEKCVAKKTSPNKADYSSCSDKSECKGGYCVTGKTESGASKKVCFSKSSLDTCNKLSDFKCVGQVVSSCVLQGGVLHWSVNRTCKSDESCVKKTLSTGDYYECVKKVTTNKADYSSCSDKSECKGGYCVTGKTESGASKKVCFSEDHLDDDGCDKIGKFKPCSGKGQKVYSCVLQGGVLHWSVNRTCKSDESCVKKTLSTGDYYECVKVKTTTPSNPSPATCTSYTTGSWGTCTNGTQIRTVTGVPSGCTGGVTKPATSQSCTITTTLKLSFKVSFDGLTPNRNCLDKFKKVDLVVGKVGTDVKQELTVDVSPISGAVNSKGLQIFGANNIALNSTLAGSSNIYVKVKGQLHGKMYFCRSGQSGKVLSQVCSVALDGSINNFADYPIIAGDINRDGVINVMDFSLVRSGLSTEAEIEEVNNGNVLCNNNDVDLNGDGVANDMDLRLVRNALSYRDDD